MPVPTPTVVGEGGLRGVSFGIFVMAINELKSKSADHPLDFTCVLFVVPIPRGPLPYTTFPLFFPKPKVTALPSMHHSWRYPWVK